MPVTTRQANGITVLDVSGPITADGSGGQVHSAVQQAVQAGTKNILLHLGGVAMVDSSGIGECIASLASVTNKGGTLKMAAVPPKVQDVLNVTKLNNVIETHDTEDAAVASFK